MGVNRGPNHGGLVDFKNLRLGHDVLLDGEKPRPRYLGSVVELRGKRNLIGQLQANEEPKQTMCSKK